MPDTINYRTWFARILPRRPFGGFFGERLGGVFALFADFLSEGMRQSTRASWIGDDVGPAPDGLKPAGNELSMPRYPVETAAQYEARLERAWEDWPFAGDESVLVAQLAAAGFPGAQIKTPLEWPTRPPVGYWSQFWVFFPAGTHSVTAAAPIVGSFIVGDGTVLGASGITPAQIYTLRALVKKFKPGHWICRGFVFEVAGWTIGDGHTVGGPGLTIGSTQVLIGA